MAHYWVVLGCVFVWKAKTLREETERGKRLREERDCERREEAERRGTGAAATHCFFQLFNLQLLHIELRICELRRR